MTGTLRETNTLAGSTDEHDNHTLLESHQLVAALSENHSGTFSAEQAVETLSLVFGVSRERACGYVTSLVHADHLLCDGRWSRLRLPPSK